MIVFHVELSKDRYNCLNDVRVSNTDLSQGEYIICNNNSSILLFTQND